MQVILISIYWCELYTFFKTFTKTLRNTKNLSVKKLFRYKFTIKCEIYSFETRRSTRTFLRKSAARKIFGDGRLSFTLTKRQFVLERCFLHSKSSKFHTIPYHKCSLKLLLSIFTFQKVIVSSKSEILPSWKFTREERVSHFEWNVILLESDKKSSLLGPPWSLQIYVQLVDSGWLNVPKGN